MAADVSRNEHVFPKLTQAQIDRVARHGRIRKITPGEILSEPGTVVNAFFLVLSGAIDIVRQSETGEDVVTVHGPGQFSGEVNMLSGRPGFVTMRAGKAGEVVEMDRQELMALVQTDGELSEILMRAFILRRVELIARGFGNAVLIGSNHCAGTLRVREFLTRNGHPYTYLDLDKEDDVQNLLDEWDIGEDDIPVLICRGKYVLKHPTNQEIADCLGFNDSVNTTRVRDVVIVGAGPAGLAAAVYASSEGLDVLMLETSAPGGQAGSSSRIENYLGFPTGISGQDLAARAYTQAEKFGTEVLITKGAIELGCDRKPYTLKVEDGTKIPCRTVIIASGAAYRKLPVPDIDKYLGAGVYHGATFMEAQLCRGDEVIVVGGGNSAGQAAVFLAEGSAKMVHMLVRGNGLKDTMSRYLIRRIENNPKIKLSVLCEITSISGELHIERVTWRNADGQVETHDIRHIFVMTGAVPSTEWLDGCLAMDSKGFVKTGNDLDDGDLAKAKWPLQRHPHLLETSLPGVFAVGDVRAGNVKRVASAVGEGSIAVSFVHQVLAE